LRREVLVPARAGAGFGYERYDAYRGRWRGRRLVPAAAIVLVEGVGLFTDDFVGEFDLTIWVDADPALALARGSQRDDAAHGGEHAGLWRTLWGPNDADFCARYDPQGRADLRYAPPANAAPQ